MIVHPFAPVFDERSDTLILGSFPSVRSREEGFYYGHPQNRFWRVIAGVYGETVPTDVDQKKRLLLAHRLALWDAAASCEIEGSRDSTIRRAEPTELALILRTAGIRRVLCNGQTAGRLYRTLQQPKVLLPCEILPSTSALNASWPYDRLLDAWKTAINHTRSFTDESAETRSVP